MLISIQKKCLLWMDWSLFFRAILKIFDGIINFLCGSLIVGLFTADFNNEKLKHSKFVQAAECVLNRFPKFLHPRGESILPPLPRVMQGSRIINFLADSMETPVYSETEKPAENIFAWFKWFGASFPAWGLLAVAVMTPFLPTMVLAGMLVVVFGSVLFRYDIKLDLTAVLLLLFIIVNIFMGFGSLAPGTSIPISLLVTVMMVSYLLIRTCFTSQVRLDFLMACVSLAAGVTALIAFYQIFIGYVNMTWVDRNLFAALQLRVYSTFGNPNVYGAYLLLAIPLAAGLFIYAAKPVYKMCAAGVAGMLVIALALTYSRGCYLALAAAVLIFMLIIEKRLIVLYLAGLAALPFVLPAGMIARIVSILDFTDTSTAFRIAIYQASIRILGDFWMAGLGQGIEAYNRAYPFYSFAAVPSPHSHNLFLQVFLETGIIGLIVFLGVLACFFRTQFSFIRNTGDTRRKILSAALTAGAIGFLLQGMFDHVFYNYRVMLFFFIYIGIANSLAEERAP